MKDGFRSFRISLKGLGVVKKKKIVNTIATDTIIPAYLHRYFQSFFNTSNKEKAPPIIPKGTHCASIKGPDPIFDKIIPRKLNLYWKHHAEVFIEISAIPL